MALREPLNRRIIARFSRTSDPNVHNSMKKSYDFSRGERGPAKPNRDTVLIAIDLDDVTFEYFKVESERTGKCYQTLINEDQTKSKNQKEQQTRRRQKDEPLRLLT